MTNHHKSGILNIIKLTVVGKWTKNTVTKTAENCLDTVRSWNTFGKDICNLNVNLPPTQDPNSSWQSIILRTLAYWVGAECWDFFFIFWVGGWESLQKIATGINKYFFFLFAKGELSKQKVYPTSTNWISWDLESG